jgi:hypothetical protein
MNNKNLIALLTSSALALFIYPVWGQSNPPSKVTFTCGEDNQGIPITVAKNNKGKTQTIFHWKQEAFKFSTTATPKLCDRIAEKFNNLALRGADLSSFELKPSEQVGVPAICLSDRHISCNSVLFTLDRTEEEPFKTADRVLQKILDAEILNNHSPQFNNRCVSMRSPMFDERCLSMEYRVDLAKLFKN